jgi:hypothetical protein
LNLTLINVLENKKKEGRPLGKMIRESAVMGRIIERVFGLIQQLT